MKLHRLLIRLISRIVPRRFRFDWMQEWEAELQHRESLLQQWRRLDWTARKDLLRRSAGAFWDALAMQPRRLEEEMFQDVRYGLRMLAKNRSFTIVAVLSLALGIGANSAVFSVIDALLLKRLPVKNPEELVIFNVVTKEGKHGSFSYPVFERFKNRNHVFSGVLASGEFTTSRMTTNPGADEQSPTRLFFRNASSRSWQPFSAVLRSF